MHVKVYDFIVKVGKSLWFNQVKNGILMKGLLNLTMKIGINSDRQKNVKIWTINLSKICSAKYGCKYWHNLPCPFFPTTLTFENYIDYKSCLSPVFLIQKVLESGTWCFVGQLFLLIFYLLFQIMWILLKGKNIMLKKLRRISKFLKNVLSSKKLSKKLSYIEIWLITS